MNLNRRVFLKQGAFALICAGGGPFLGPGFLRQAAMAAELGATTASSRNKVLLCIFQRGAVDGLSMVVPYGDPDYAKVRPDIALGAPSVAAGANATIDLDGYFGLHPSLASLAPLFQSGSLAAIQACGSPHASRSHFTSQDLMESGRRSSRVGAGRLAQPSHVVLPGGLGQSQRLSRRGHDVGDAAQPAGR